MKNNTMYSKNISNILLWATCFIMLLPIIIILPSSQPSDWSRVILFKSTLAVLTSFLLFRFFYKNDLSVEIPRCKMSYCLPAILLSAFLLCAMLSTAFSQDFQFSFFGGPSRAGGFLNLAFYYIFAIFLALFIKKEQWGKLWITSFTAASLASLLAIVQSFNLLKNVFVSYEGGGVPSFLGNSTFLAIYLIFNAIWAFIFILKKEGKKQKMIYGGLFLLFSLGIFLSGSRATYLALVTSFIFFLLFYPFNIKRVKTLKITAASLLIFVLIIICIFNFFPQLGQKNKIFARLVNRLSIEKVSEDLFGTRFAVWEITLKAIKEKPLLGWGPENFYIGFEKYYNPTVSNMQRLWWDRPHNIFLDVASQMGLLSLFFYIAFWLAIFWSLQRFKNKMKNLGSDEKILHAHGLQAIFIGYLITLFFNFDSFSTYLISFFFVGYSFYLLLWQNNESIEIKNQQKFITEKNKKIIAGVYTLALVLFIIFWNIKPLYLNELVKKSANLASAGKCDKATSIMDGVNKNPGIIAAYSALTYSDIIKKCPNTDKEIEYATKGLDALKKAAAIQPTWSRTWLFMGGLEDVLAAREEDPTKKDKLLQEARKYLNQALKISPKRIEILVEVEKNYLIAKDYQTMKKIANDCIAIDESQGICYWYMGIPEIFLGDQVNGKKHIQQALEKGGFSPQYIQLGSAYISQNNYKDAALVYHQLTANYPDNASYHAVMAYLSKEIGDYDRAGTEAMHVFRLQPDNEESVQFLQSLLGLSPNSPVVHTSMAFVYREIGEMDKFNRELNIAKNIYIQLANANPNIPDYHYRLAIIYAEQGEYKKSYQESLLTIKMAGPTDLNTKEKIESFIQNVLPIEIWDEYQRNYK